MHRFCFAAHRSLCWTYGVKLLPAAATSRNTFWGMLLQVNGCRGGCQGVFCAAVWKPFKIYQKWRFSGSLQLYSRSVFVERESVCGQHEVRFRRKWVCSLSVWPVWGDRVCVCVLDVSCKMNSWWRVWVQADGSCHQSLICPSSSVHHLTPPLSPLYCTDSVILCSHWFLITGKSIVIGHIAKSHILIPHWSNCLKSRVISQDASHLFQQE